MTSNEIRELREYLDERFAKIDECFEVVERWPPSAESS